MAAVATAAVGFLAFHHANPPQRCPAGLISLGPRCCGQGQRLIEGRCVGQPTGCAVDMESTAAGCVARAKPLAIAGGQLVLGPVDWEAQRRVQPYKAQIAPFQMDSHEVTEQRYTACVQAKRCQPRPQQGEPGLPQTHINASQAADYCRWRGGSLPTRDQLAFAVMGSDKRRYPWGQTGAVCRRATFGLRQGPCGHDGKGPELAGARPSGASADGVHDLAGNVAEWSQPQGGRAHVRGGSWRTTGAAELRGWSYREVAPEHLSGAIGFRCVYNDSRSAR